MNSIKYTNNTGISLSMAVWLAHDLYDHNDDPQFISASEIIKSVKQIILSKRIPKNIKPNDLSSVVKAQSGTALHTAIEYSWLNNYKESMKDLGYPDSVIDKIRLNPSKQRLLDDNEKGNAIIPIYMEKRSQRLIEGKFVTGKFDIVIDGRLEDFKSTSTYIYTNQSKINDYRLQGSIYRWLNTDIITNDYMNIQYIFSNWTASQAKFKPGYPPHGQMSQKIRLLSLNDTERYLSDKIIQIRNLEDEPESEIPDCTKSDLWQTNSIWKFYKNPNKTSRSTKNFDNSIDANMYLLNNGGTGMVIEVKGQVKACNYCSVFGICKQKNTYILDGSLKI